MHIELAEADLTFMDGASAMMIDNLAQMAAPFGIKDELLRAGSVLEAAELVFESVPSPYLEHIIRAMPKSVVKAASKSVSRESRALIDLGADGFDHDAVVCALHNMCPIAFIASRGIASFGFEACYDKFHKDFDLRQIGPGSGEWSLWEGCEKAWVVAHESIAMERRGKPQPTAIFQLEQALKLKIRHIGLLEPFARSKYNSVIQVKFDIFAWKVETSFH
jgi:hypothetical protein